MRELPYLCIENAHFTLNNKTYLQVDGVSIASHLDPVLANIFMVGLEGNMIPNCFIKVISINEVLETCNSYHKSIEFTIEIETENKISFLYVLLIRNSCLLNTKV